MAGTTLKPFDDTAVFERLWKVYQAGEKVDEETAIRLLMTVGFSEEAARHEIAFREAMKNGDPVGVVGGEELPES